MHLHAYKNLEGGARVITPRNQRLFTLTEREHARAMFALGDGAVRQAYSTADRALERMMRLEADGLLVRNDGSRKFRYLSLFSGIEAATAAFERIGSDAVPVGFADIDPTANSVLRHRWPDVPRLGDVTTVDWSLLRGHVDLVVGGSPCQSFSVAGKRLGISDPRGNLALHFLRAVAAIQPRWVLFENVPGLLTSGDGDDYKGFLNELQVIGYSCAWRILDAQHFGVPQRRRRLFLVAEHSRSARGPEQILSLGRGAEGHSQARGAKWKAAARRAPLGAGEIEPDLDWSHASAWLADHDGTRTIRRHAANDDAFSAVVAAGGRPVNPAKGARNALPRDQVATVPDDEPTSTVYAADMRHGTIGAQASTLQSRQRGGWALNAMPCVVHDSNGENIVRRFSPLECLRLQGFDDDWFDGPRLGGKPINDGDRYRLVGNSWAVPVAVWILERLLAVHVEPRPI
ncbi:DNA cytosine methyltransferase [Lichenicola sp.]|uniref:DNA cytosine methyltransferase n=1 Tax=Lichenicola sp. TaxID=2804529 RepID=UPI003AFF8B6E